MAWPKKNSYNKWLTSKKLEDKLEYKRNTALAKREVRRRQRFSWDKFVTNPKTTEVLVSLTLVTKFTLKFSTWNYITTYSETFMTETQNEFRKGQSCTDPTFCLKLLIEKRREFNLETFAAHRLWESIR
jgi:hypothetical protein